MDQRIQEMTSKGMEGHGNSRAELFMWNMSKYNICHHWWRYLWTSLLKLRADNHGHLPSHGRILKRVCLIAEETQNQSCWGHTASWCIILYRSCFKRRDERSGQVSLLAFASCVELFPVDDNRTTSMHRTRSGTFTLRFAPRRPTHSTPRKKRWQGWYYGHIYFNLIHHMNAWHKFIYIYLHGLFIYGASNRYSQCMLGILDCVIICHTMTMLCWTSCSVLECWTVKHLPVRLVRYWQPWTWRAGFGQLVHQQSSWSRVGILADLGSSKAVSWTEWVKSHIPCWQSSLLMANFVQLCTHKTLVMYSEGLRDRVIPLVCKEIEYLSKRNLFNYLLNVFSHRYARIIFLCLYYIHILNIHICIYTCVHMVNAQIEFMLTCLQFHVGSITFSCAHIIYILLYKTNSQIEESIQSLLSTPLWMMNLATSKEMLFIQLFVYCLLLVYTFEFRYLSVHVYINVLLT